MSFPRNIMDLPHSDFVDFISNLLSALIPFRLQFAKEWNEIAENIDKKIEEFTIGSYAMAEYGVRIFQYDMFNKPYPENLRKKWVSLGVLVEDTQA